MDIQARKRKSLLGATAPVPLSPNVTPAKPDVEKADDSKCVEQILRIYRIPWAVLLKVVFALDVLVCPNCGGGMQLMACLTQPAVAKRILDHLGLDSTTPPLARAQAPPEPFDSGPDYAVPDPIYTD